MKVLKFLVLVLAALCISCHSPIPEGALMYRKEYTIYGLLEETYPNARVLYHNDAEKFWVVSMPDGTILAVYDHFIQLGLFGGEVIEIENLSDEELKEIGL